MSSCSKLIEELQKINADNNKDYLQRQESINNLTKQRIALQNARDSIYVPSTNVSDYPPVWTESNYGCDEARYNAHRKYCNNFGGNNMYEWTGEMQHTWGACTPGLGGCCTTIGACRPRQSYLDSVASDANTKKSNYNKEISSLDAQMMAIKTAPYKPVPDIGCCQDVDLSGIQGGAYIDSITQQCIIPGQNGQNGSGQDSGQDTEMSKEFMIIIFIIIVFLGASIGLIIYLSRSNKTPKMSETSEEEPNLNSPAPEL